MGDFNIDFELSYGEHDKKNLVLFLTFNLW